MFDVKILESRAKSIYKLKNIKILKRNITGLREVEILKKHRNFSQEKKLTERKNDLVRFLAFEVTPKSETIVRFATKFPLSIFVTVALSSTLL